MQANGATSQRILALAARVTLRGVVAVTGNAWNLTANLTAIAEHKAERWIFGGKAFATYGESRAAGSATGSRRRPRNAGLFLRGDDRFTRRLSGYLLGGIETKIPWDTTLAVTLDYLQ